MADNSYDFDALITAGTQNLVDDGSGNDWIFVTQEHTISQTSINNGGYAVRIFLTTSTYVEGQSFSQLMIDSPDLIYKGLTISGIIENIMGGPGRELLSGNSSANYIQGDSLDDLGGNDWIGGLGGADTLVGAGGSDKIYGDAGNDLIFGDSNPEAQAETNFAAGDDSLYGGADNDTLIGGAGTNDLNGDAGFDTVSYAYYHDEGNGGYRVVVDMAAGTATTYWIDPYDGSQTVYATDHISNVERIVGSDGDDYIAGSFTFTGADPYRDAFEGGLGNDTMIGSIDAEDIFGGAGHDLLDGRSNNNVDYVADRLFGGVGNDSYQIHEAGVEVIENPGEGKDTVYSDLSYRLGYNLENLTLTAAAGAASATGNVLDNRLEGNAFANTLDGRQGLDTLAGGAGNDIYIVYASETLTVYTSITELAGGGTDTIRSATTMGLGLFDQVENLILTGTGNSTGSGNALINRITGNSGNNELSHWGAHDTLAGGAGNDTYYVGDASTVLIETAGGGYDTLAASVSLTLSLEVEKLALQGSENLSGTGNLQANTLLGNSGKNLLSGLAGDDTLRGGLGDDTLRGGDGRDNFAGEAGNDSIDGGTGIDTLAFSGTVAVTVNLALTTGQNTGYGFDIISGIESLGGGTLSDSLRGNTLANFLSGGSGDDQLFGDGGNDQLFGGAGNDSLSGDLGNDSLYGGSESDTAVYLGPAAISVNLALTGLQVTGAGTDVLSSIENLTTGTGNDILRGNSDANTLHGGAGADSLLGGAGADWLYGDAGNDALQGGGDADVFVFTTNSGTDRIVDFQNGIDHIVMGAFASVTVQDSGANVILTYGTTHVTILNIEPGQISPADFLIP